MNIGNKTAKIRRGELYEKNLAQKKLLDHFVLCSDLYCIGGDGYNGFMEKVWKSV